MDNESEIDRLKLDNERRKNQQLRDEGIDRRFNDIVAAVVITLFVLIGLVIWWLS